MFRLHRGLPPIGPGSLRLALSTLAQPRRHTPLGSPSAGCRAASSRTDPLKDIVRRVGARRTGSTTRASGPSRATTPPGGGSPSAARTLRTPTLADAVAASCAIPGFYRPVDIGGRRYVDGGVRSASNLDLLAGHELDLVICLNPTSTRAGGARASSA